MGKIFISHCHADTDLLEDMKGIFKETNVEPIIYTKYSGEDWKKIRKDIRDSDAVFVLLGPSIEPVKRETAHTQKWIAFEIGIACGCEPKKKVYVFHPAYNPSNEKEYDKNKYVVPYLTDYIYYDSNDPISYQITLDNIKKFDPDPRTSFAEE